MTHQSKSVYNTSKAPSKMSVCMGFDFGEMTDLLGVFYLLH